MQIKKFLFAFPVALISIFFVYCAKEQEAPVAEEPKKDNSLVQTIERGEPCPRQIVHYTDLASTTGPGTAFMYMWMQELDIIANNCVLDNSLCQTTASHGQTSFVTTPNFIKDILQLAGLDGSWPYVTPQGQDFIISYTLNWARTHLTPCEIGTPKILAVDYYRDAFITQSLGFTVRWVCCGVNVDHE